MPGKANLKFRRFCGIVLLAVIVLTCFSIWLYFDAQYQQATRELNEYQTQKQERLEREQRFQKFQWEHRARVQNGAGAY